MTVTRSSHRTEILDLWLYPPLAFARVGPSPTPCDNYNWSANDLRPQGSGKTTVIPRETLVLSEDGTLSACTPTTVVFKDDEGFRPLCPYFELHGLWRDDHRVCRGPITDRLLDTSGFKIKDVSWTVTVANLKPYHHTQRDGDRIVAHLEVSSDDTQRHVLAGISYGPRPLVPEGKSIPLGWIQVTKLSTDFPECRMRFTPPKGLVYAPTGFHGRVHAAVKANATTRWRDSAGRPFRLPDEQLILNDESVWATWAPELKPYVTHRGHPDFDFRTMPVKTYASDDTSGDPPRSMGLVDDVSDGVVRCRLGGLEAVARIVVAPPHFAPDRRPMISLADGLKDRVAREEVLDKAYLEKEEETTNEVRDLLERGSETQGLMNLDFLNDKAIKANTRIAEGQSRRIPGLDSKLFPRLSSVEGRPLPLTELGRQRHRRMLALEVLEDRLREDPLVIERFIRPPVSGESFFDQRMPAFIKGSDSRPMSLTRRQFDLLTGWARGLRARLKPGE